MSEPYYDTISTNLLTDESNPYYGDFYEDCEPPVRVYIDGAEIPVINEGVETQARIDGPMDINKVTDVYFPIEWQGEDIGDYIDAYDPGTGARNVWQPVDIEFYDESLDEYRVYHRGFIMAYGAGSKGNLERRLRIGDVGMLLNGIPFTGSYDHNATIGDMITDIIDEFEDNQTIFDVVDVAEVDELVDSDAQDDYGFRLGGELSITQVPLGGLDYLTSDSVESFERNKHTLQDAMDVVTNKLDAELYFAAGDPDNRREIALILDRDRSRDFTAQHISGDGPHVIENNALYEIQPINSVTVNGSTGGGIVDTVTGAFSDEDQFPTATARHTRLYELAGTEYKPPIQQRDGVETESEAIAEAQEILINEIEGGGMGEIILELFPQIEPHDTIESKPACGDGVTQDVTPITYSVEEVSQNVGYTDDGDWFQKTTNLRVNTKVTADDIEIVESGLESV